MRRLIPAKQAKGLEKLNENIVINEDGTLVEMGGNIAVESVEQLGYLVDTPTTAEVRYLYSNEAFDVCSGVTSATGTTLSEGGPDNIKEGYVQCAAGTFFVKINGTVYNFASGSITVTGNIIAYREDLVTIEPGGKEFKPFFTEEQYEALLALIEN